MNKQYGALHCILTIALLVLIAIPKKSNGDEAGVQYISMEKTQYRGDNGTRIRFPDGSYVTVEDLRHGDCIFSGGYQKALDGTVTIRIQGVDVKYKIKGQRLILVGEKGSMTFMPDSARRMLYE